MNALVGKKFKIILNFFKKFQKNKGKKKVM